jgi:hypothetical protein
MRYKYPRTPHLPSSPGASANDIFSTANLEGKEVVVTEKMDGENTTLYSDYYHARSIDGRGHESQSWLKRYHAGLAHTIPSNWRLCGENLYAVHSIKYHYLPQYFLLFSIWEAETCFSWTDTVELASELGVELVPVLYEGVYSAEAVKECIKGLDLSRQEGLVVRIARCFNLDEFSNSVAKWVRSDHVTTDEHWRNKQIAQNCLLDSKKE